MAAVLLEPPAHEIGERPALRIPRQRLEPELLALGPPLHLDEEALRLGLRLGSRRLGRPRARWRLELYPPHRAAPEDGTHRDLASLRVFGAAPRGARLVHRGGRRAAPASTQARSSPGINL